MRYFKCDGMEILGIICNNYECNGSIQIKFEREVENYFWGY